MYFSGSRVCLYYLYFSGSRVDGDCVVLVMIRTQRGYLRVPLSGLSVESITRAFSCRQALARISSACRTLGPASLGRHHRVLPWDPRISFYSAAGNSAIISDLNVRGANWLISPAPPPPCRIIYPATGQRTENICSRHWSRMFSFRARSRCLVFTDRAPATTAEMVFGPRF